MNRWPASLSRHLGGSPQPSWSPLRIVSRGMCCAVGHHAPAATAAINARMNHFRETEFVAQGGIPIIGGALFDVGAWGAERLSHMLQLVVAEAIAGQETIDPAHIALIVVGAENGRPGQSSHCLAETLANLLSQRRSAGTGFHATSRFCAHGKGGIARALTDAAALMAHEHGPHYVLLAGVDSQLDAGAIEHYLDDERIATKDNADGFIPAEGAAAVLLSREANDAPATWIDAVATAEEPWRFASDLPVRALGLTDALRSAARSAGTEIAGLDFHASGMTGEAWYAKEVNLALSRCMERKKSEFQHLIVTRSVGETGAAAPLLSLAWLAALMGRGNGSPGKAGLLHFAGDDGQRSALVVRHRTASCVAK